MIGVFGITCITIIEIYALHKGIDGKALSLAIGSIAGFIGYYIKQKKRR